MTVTPVRAEQTQIKVQDLPQGEVVEAKTYPWSAIGKFNNGVGGSCTAVLISQNYALTAAHCLFLKNTGRYLPAQSFHLIFGYENQQFRDHLRVSAFYVSPKYEPTRPYETLASDWALLSISGQPTTRPLDISQPYNTAESLLMTAGYSHQTPYAMTADRQCRFVGRSHDGSLIYDTCHAPAGFSGAPVIVSNADKRSHSIVGIHVANQVWQAQSIAIAIPIEVILREIEPCIKDHNCQFQHVATGTEPTAAEILAGLRSSPLCATKDQRCKTTLIGP